MVPILGYWNFRGLGEQIRLLLHYLGVEFEEKIYKSGPAQDFDRSMWLSEKFNLGLRYPNLPFYIDGDLKLTQSLAILEYIADEHGMVPNCKKQRATLHMIHNAVSEARLFFMMAGYNLNNQGDPHVTRLHGSLKMFEEELGDKIWLTGDKINYPDLSLCELLNKLEKFEPSYLSEFPKLKAYLTRFENLPAIKDYMASDEFKTRACWNIFARWKSGN
ncbi:hypothetical protein Aperf_G00000056583 [Anoplocephala perfoliata]